MCLNHPKTIPHLPSPWKNCLPRNRSLVTKRLGTAVLIDKTSISQSSDIHLNDFATLYIISTIIHFIFSLNILLSHTLT